MEEDSSYTNIKSGLSSNNVKRLREKFGFNEVADKTQSLWSRIGTKFWAPIQWMLEIAIVLQLILGEYTAALITASLLLMNAALGFLYESRAQATLNVLKSGLALTACVRRDGVWKSIPARELVPGDVIKLTLGSIAGADAKLAEGDILLDHSSLTGESLPIEAWSGFQTFAGAVVRSGEAIARVTATGRRTKFGRTAELVQTARAVGSQQKSVLHIVRNLAIFNGMLVLIQLAYALMSHMPRLDILSLILTAVLAAIPVALPATFTLATALGARALGRVGVLPTRLSAIDEAAMMDVLCTDKTGTLTQNVLMVTKVHAIPGFTETNVLAFAALACSDGGKDFIDMAIRSASSGGKGCDLPQLKKFIPFDPMTKTAQAIAFDAEGREMHILKGAFARILEQVPASPALIMEAEALEAKGNRVLAVAVGTPDTMEIIGIIAFSDLPRGDSAKLIAELKAMGVHTVMVTGDSRAVAGVISDAVGLKGEVCPHSKPPAAVSYEDFAVYAGVFPEDKFQLVRAFQNGGHVVGMCGDGVNDAPALKQAQMGIAVSTATDAAKSAAGVVLTNPGLSGIIATIREGRKAFQRIFTYTLRSITRKMDQVLFLTVGLLMTGHAVLTPVLIVILMLTGDLLALSATTDNVRPSAKPNHWQIDKLTIAGIILGICNLTFCTGILAVGYYKLKLATPALQTLATITLVFCGQSFVYVARERKRIWSSMPGPWVILSSLTDIAIVVYLAVKGILMAALPMWLVFGVLLDATLYAFVLDDVKVMLFSWLNMEY